MNETDFGYDCAINDGRYPESNYPVLVIEQFEGIARTHYRFVR